MAEIESTMDASEFAEWCSLMAIEPWGGARLDVLSAMQQHAALAAASEAVQQQQHQQQQREMPGAQLSMRTLLVHHG